MLFFLLLSDGDDPFRDGLLKEDAFVRGLDDFPLKTNLSLPSDVLITEFSLGIDCHFLGGEKYNL